MVEILSLLVAAVVAALLFTRLGLGSVLGYLAAGAVLGPSGLGLVADPDNMRHIGEFGVVFLLFLIGIEIKPQRLWVMRHMVFGMGGVQVMATGLALAAGAWLAADLPSPAALVVGFSLALSSTAFGLQILSERGALASQWGRTSFSVLLFQDLAVVPLMMLFPLLASGSLDVDVSMGVAALQAALVFGIILIGGRYAVGPVLHLIAKSRNRDAFVAATLLLVLGFGWVTEQAGLSMAMGAFISGLLLSNSEFRHQVEADVLPFRGLLLGLFFMSVGMTLRPGVLTAHFGLVVGGTLGLLAVKALLAAITVRLFRMPTAVAIRSGFLLSQGGEFGFILFAIAGQRGLLSEGLMEPLIAVIVLGLVATPLMVRLGDALAVRFGTVGAEALEPPREVHERPVLIAGFGRVGETVANMLRAVEVPCVAIDMNADHVAKGRRMGHTVYFGDASRPEVLNAVGAGMARLFVVTLDDPHAAEGTVRTFRRQYQDIPVHVRVRDWKDAEHFTALGANHAIPETVEASLRLGAAALEAAGVGAAERRALFEELSADHYARMKAQAAAHIDPAGH